MLGRLGRLCQGGQVGYVREVREGWVRGGLGCVREIKLEVGQVGQGQVRLGQVGGGLGQVGQVMSGRLGYVREVRLGRLGYVREVRLEVGQVRLGRLGQEGLGRLREVGIGQIGDWGWVISWGGQGDQVGRLGQGFNGCQEYWVGLVRCSGGGFWQLIFWPGQLVGH